MYSRAVNLPVWCVPFSSSNYARRQHHIEITFDMPWYRKLSLEMQRRFLAVIIVQTIIFIKMLLIYRANLRRFNSLHRYKLRINSPKPCFLFTVRSLNFFLPSLTKKKVRTSHEMHVEDFSIFFVLSFLFESHLTLIPRVWILSFFSGSWVVFTPLLLPPWDEIY